MRFCAKCGAENGSNSKFCKSCGQEIKKEIMQSDNNYYGENSGQNNSFPECGGQEQYLHKERTEIPVELINASERKTASKNSAVKILVIVLSVILAVLLGIAAWIFINNTYVAPEESDDVKDTKQQQKVKEKEDAVSVSEETENEDEKNKFERNSTYSSDFVYGNMEDIHDSKEASDEECFELEEILTDYNSKWISYINDGDRTIYKYLREGTDAYDTTGNYEEPAFSEKMLYMKVEDVRTSGDTYYVWCHEKIEKYWDSGSYEEKEYRWVYKVGKDSDGFYVEEYTTDPYYA